MGRGEAKILETTDFPEIVKKLEAGLKENNLVSIYEDIEKPLLEVIKHMNDTGVILNTTYLKTLSKTMHKELSSLEKSIHKYVGDSEFNINSPKPLPFVLVS